MTDRELMQQALDAFEWNMNTDLDNIPACEEWAKKARKNIKAIRARLAQPEQEPVSLNKVIIDSIRDSSEIVAPPQREWVGLTDDEIEDAGKLNVEGARMLPYSFARAIEAKLKEKNT